MAQGLHSSGSSLPPWALAKGTDDQGSHRHSAVRYMPRNVPLQTTDSKGTALVVPKPKTGRSRAARLRTYGNVTSHPPVYAATSGTPLKSSDDNTRGKSTS